MTVCQPERPGATSRRDRNPDTIFAGTMASLHGSHPGSIAGRRTGEMTEWTRRDFLIAAVATAQRRGGAEPADLARIDAVGQAELVRRKKVSPLELVDAAIRRIEKVNPQLNAVVWERFEKARGEARGSLPDGPFRGVPFL